MATDNQDDLISQDQQDLDQQQGITSEGEVGSVPTGPTNQQLLDKITALESQQRGNQGFMDKAANAIRRDIEGNVKQQFETLRTEQSNQAWLSSLDEEQRPLAEGLLNRMPQPAPQKVEVSPELVSAWDGIVQWVESMGVKRDDPRVNYNQMMNPDGTPNMAASATFRDSVLDLRHADKTTAPAPIAPAPKTDNPSVQEGPRVSSGDANTVEEVRQAFIDGVLNREQFAEKMTALKEPF